MLYRIDPRGGTALNTIAGRYQITAKLGEGGMGIVYRAYDPAPMDREVAVKTLHEFADPMALDLFYKECTALKSISHPNIVEIFDMGEFDDGGHRKPFFVMPLLQGQTLDELIRHASHRLTVDRVVDIISQTCRGLQAAHERGLIHRDLKPSNIFVMADDSVKIIDFGVAHVVSANTRSGGYDKGTLIYMAPEQVQHKPVSIQSDIYSLAVAAYEALTRRQPFRGGTEEAVIQAILTHIPPPASDLNPSVSHVISRVIHKAMAKQPWNRFDSAREFGETLQKAARNEPIALFDPSRTQPRIQTAARALEKGDYQFAGEIVGELEAEGNIDPEITLLRTQIDQIARQKTIGQLLESARARFEEDEDPLALQKLHEILQLDPGNVGALALKSKIEDRRSDRQIEKWVQLARQHVDNHSYGHAREALQNALLLRPKDSRASRLLKEIESEEQEYVRVRREKTDLYQAAVNAWKNGEVSQALSQMKLVLELDRRAPDASSPDAAGVYQSFYNKIRSEHESLNAGYAEARRLLADRQFGRALEVCHDFLSRYPGQALFQALKFDIEEQQRQQLSAFIAEVDRRLEAEPDLEAKLGLLRDAVVDYPEEPHFARLLKLFQDKRDLVNSIVERARIHEEKGQIGEALGDLETLQTIYGNYAGLRFERERLQKRLEQQTRDAAKARWARQIDQQLQIGSFPKAIELLDKAQSEFPDDAELVELRKVATQAAERSARAQQLAVQGQALCADGQFDQGVELVKNALQLDDRPSVRLTLRDLFVGRAQQEAGDWRTVEAFAERALEIDPSHSLARSLRAQAADLKREETVGECASQARRLQASGDIDAALAEIDRGLALYPADPRLSAIRDALITEAQRLRPRGPAAPPPAAPASSERSSPSASPTAGSGSGMSAASPSPAEEPEFARTRLVVGRRPGERTPLPTGVPIGTGPGSSPHEVLTDGSLDAAGVAAATVVRTEARPANVRGTSSSRTPMRAAAGIALVGVIAAGAILYPRFRGAPDPQDAVTAAVEAPSTPAIVPAATGTAPAETPSTDGGVDSTAAPDLASIELRQLPRGLRVLLDSKAIGTVGADGTLTYAGIAPGRHSLQFVLQGYEPLTVSREFASGTAVTLTPVEIVLKRAQATLDVLADPSTQVAVVQAGQTVQKFSGPTKLALPEGAYEITARGPANVPTIQALTVSAGESRTVDLRAVVTSMERFDQAGWRRDDSWLVRRGGGFVLYDTPGTDGKYSFTIPIDRNGNPFSSGSRLRWVVAYLDNSNYVMLQLDDDTFYRSDVVNGKDGTVARVPHRIPTNRQFVHLSVQVSGSQLVHQYSVQDGVWQTIENWNRTEPPGASGRRTPLAGRFGFFLPGNEELKISNFFFYPPGR